MILNALKSFTKQIIKFAVYKLYSGQLKYTRHPCPILFILGHTRSGSSLLANILASHSEILGIGETWITYKSANDFKILVKHIHWKLRKFWISSYYALDKILHNHFIQDSSILINDDIKVIFIIRSPEDSLASILKMGIRFDPLWIEEDALLYYCNRLSALENYAQVANDKNKCFFLTYDILVKETELTLQALQKFLKLSTLPSKNYNVTNLTGCLGLGDDSPNIRSGTVLSTHKSSAADIKISSEILTKAKLAYSACSATLLEYCSVPQDW